MTLSEFWDGDPILVKVFREAHVMRNEIDNQKLWIQGLYNYKAFSSVIESVVYSFSGGKGSKPSKYPERPFPLTEDEQKAFVESNKQRTLAWVEQGQH